MQAAGSSACALIMPEEIAKRVVVVAWPAANWKTVSKLIDEGALPHLARLVENGTTAHLPSLLPEFEPMLYTSVATGTTADRHGILSACECDPRTGELCAPWSTSRKSKAIWNVLSEAGKRPLVVNWPGQFPAEHIEGTSVSADLFACESLRPVNTAPPESVWPAALGRRLAQLCLHPSELRGDDLLPFIPRLAEIDQRQDPRVEALARSLARAASVQAAATWLMEQGPWQFLAVFHDFIRATLVQFAARDASGYYEHVVEAAYRFSDQMLGRITELAGPESVTILISASGWQPRQTATERALPWYSTRGFCVVTGPGIRRDEVIHGATLLDIAPTALALLGVPAAPGMQGRAMLRRGGIMQPEAATGEGDAREQESSPVAAEALAELERLGYSDPALDKMTENRRRVAREKSLNLAVVYLDTGRAQRAIGVLEKLVHNTKADETCGTALVYAYAVAGEWDLLRNLLPQVPETKTSAPALAVMRSMLRVAEGNVSEALACLKEAEQSESEFPMLAYGIGCVYARMRKWRRAERAFRLAAERHPEFWLAQQAQALALARAGKHREAAEVLRASLQTNFAASSSHYLLGAALSELGEAAAARQAFQRSLALAREGW
jgi:tetratricopeptide (TPR) repeat protein